ncbi:expressed unknown protein [Ectocarpus siliculosus]|uniref:Uncharacterized protein n=1 Tax=Ectocarpus siliculosus TaxID=2880 RepID=D7FST8_ECTSI|nr:expressed unknown protein [Ectocarpus siliculosus]|eukprot:CBJ31229.1 expressed unknown protein [Ectocarpus siliculosus]
MSSIVNGLFGAYPAAEQRPKEYEFSVDFCPGAFGANLICSSVHKPLFCMSHFRFHLFWPTTA